MLTTMDKLHMHLEVAKTIVPYNQIVGIFLRGSQNYGLDTSNSDVDSLCLVVPSLDDIAKMHRPFSKEVKVGDDGGHITFMDIREFIKQLRTQNPNVLEVLFTKFAIRSPGFAMNWYQLYKEREKIARYRPCAALNTTCCMAITELARMKKRGYTSKQLALILRLENLMGDYIWGKDFADCLYVGDYGNIKKIKCGVMFEDPAEGMYLAEMSVKCMKKWYDQYCLNNPDNILADVEALLDKMQYKFIADHLEWELGERNEDETSN